ncbi:hypothetical protein H4R24_002219 [Coemansia sp. RSA 988]|nr:hypothetical protein H4R24_002219 [Coemansia sp. RSA 988]
MPVTTGTYICDLFVRELKLTQEARISTLSDTRLGIEGHNWLRQLLFSSRDGDSVASGGVPLALEAEIVKEVRFFQTHGITPVFVFSGLPVARKEHRAFAKDDHRVAYRHSAWEQYWQGHVEQAQRGWSASPSQAVADLIPFAMQVLQENGVEFMRAPYSAWAQLAYLYQHESQPIHAVYSSLDVLMFGVDRVITSISHTRSTFGWVQREHLLSKCGIAAEQVLDMCILAGFDWCSTFPALLTDIGFSFKSAVDVTRQYGSGFNAVQMMGDHAGVRASNYSDSFLRAYCAVRYHIVLHLDGSVGPLNADSAPNDLHDIIGYRLPATAYHLLARGIVHPPVLSMLASGSWLVFPPPDNGESDEYRRLITRWQADVFRQQCRMLCSRLGPFFAQRKITLQVWFDPQTEIVLHDSKAASDTSGMVLLGVGAEAAQEAHPATVVDVESALGRCATITGAGASKGGEQLATVLMFWLLQSLRFVTCEGQHTRLGTALQAGLRALPRGSSSGTLQWAVVAGAVLLDQGLLTDEPWSVAYEDKRFSAGNTEQQRFVRVVSRIATLVPPPARRGQWNLAYNRDLLAFCSAVKLVYRTAGACVDVACLATPASSTAGCMRQLLALRRAMPLECAASAATGLLTHKLLREHVLNGPGSWARTQAAAGDSIVDAQQSLRNVWCVAEAVRAIASALSGAQGGVVAEALDWARVPFDDVLAGKK